MTIPNKRIDIREIEKAFYEREQALTMAKEKAEQELVAVKEDLEKERALNKDLESELVQLHAQLVELSTKLAKATSRDEKKILKKEIEKLKKNMSSLAQENFSSSSEKRNNKKKPHKKPKRPKHTGKTPQPKLEKETVECKLEKDACHCATCGGDFKEVEGKHTTQETIVVVERKYKIITYEKQHYRCSCSHKKVAPAPVTSLRKRGRYDISVAIQVALDKYMDHLPLECQVRRMNRSGLKVTSQAMWDQIDALAAFLKLIYKAIGEKALSLSYLHMDFTNWYVTIRKGKKRTHYLTCLSHDQIVYFKIIPRRNQVEVAQLLGDYSGVIISDADKTITSLQKAKDRGVNITVKTKDNKKEKVYFQCNYTQAGCWSHARRPFYKAEKLYLPSSDILDQIQELYHKEAEFKEQANGDRALLVSIRKQHRPKECKAIVDKIYQLKDELKAKLKNDILGYLKKGIDYLENQEDALCHFLKEPNIEMDNNEAERLIRPSVQGRMRLVKKSARIAYPLMVLVL